MNLEFPMSIIENIKVVTLEALVTEKIIDEKVAEEWCENHTIILRKKSIFKTISNKWRKSKSTEGNRSFMIVVKKVFQEEREI